LQILQHRGALYGGVSFFAKNPFDRVEITVLPKQIPSGINLTPFLGRMALSHHGLTIKIKLYYFFGSYFLVYLFCYNRHVLTQWMNALNSFFMSRPFYTCICLAVAGWIVSCNQKSNTFGSEDGLASERQRLRDLHVQADGRELKLLGAGDGAHAAAHRPILMLRPPRAAHAIARAAAPLPAVRRQFLVRNMSEQKSAKESAFPRLAWSPDG